MLDCLTLPEADAIIATYTPRTLVTIADPRPGLFDAEWREWNHLRYALATGSGVRRKPILNRDAPLGAFQRGLHADAPYVVLAYDECSIGQGALSPSLLMAGGRYRRIIVPGPGVDDMGEPIPEHPGEIDMDHYRRIQRARRVLDTKSRYVMGWRPPAEHKPLFGTDRFRTFSQEPYFPDRCGPLAYIDRNTTRWNDYSLTSNRSA